MSAHTPGPFTIDNWGDCVYVVSDSGVRMAECDDKEKAEQVCAALNGAYYFAKAIGSAE